MHWLYIYVSFKEIIIKIEHNKEIVEKIIIKIKYLIIVNSSDLNLINQSPYHGKFDDFLEAPQQ